VMRNHGGKYGMAYVMSSSCFAARLFCLLFLVSALSKLDCGLKYF